MVAAVDSTGYDARPVSGYFVRRCGRRGTQRRWPKVTAVIDVRTHAFLSATVTRGPRQDAPQLIPAVRAAANHATCRETLGVRSTVIALNWRGSRKWPRAKYRRQMVRRFRKRTRAARRRRVYAQRVQAESVFSRVKRRLGASVAAIAWAYQKTEIRLKLFAHNVMLLAPRIST